MNKQLILPSLAVGLAATAIFATATFAYQGNTNTTGNTGTNFGPNYTPERHEIMTKAFDSNDYESWKAQMEKTNSGKRVLSVINKENFAKFAESHKLMLDGKIDEANAIRAELGLNGGGRGKGGRGGNGSGCGMRGN